jgi:hypothetical protein
MILMRRFLFLTIFMGLFFSAQGRIVAAESHFYQGENVSHVDWESLQPESWFDIRKWKEENFKRENDPLWTLKMRETDRREIMGYVVSCVGQCFLIRGEASIQVSSRTRLKEGDDLQTKEDSYLWLFLVDGTLVRLSPKSSLSLQEINISSQEFFFVARINEGFVYWRNRSLSIYEASASPETDPLFYPLRWYAANPPLEGQDFYSDKDLYQYLVSPSSTEKQSLLLNQHLIINNKIIKNKKTLNFLVFPNGSVFGEQIQMLAFITPGQESFFKLLIENGVASTDEKEVRPKEFYYRGHNNSATFKTEYDRWYEVDKNGKNILEKTDLEGTFGPQEFLVKRIPTILLAREMMLEHYSLGLFEPSLTINSMAFRYGYRLWKDFDLDFRKVNDQTGLEFEYLQARWAYLKEFTRRIESTNLFVLFNLLKKYQGEQESAGEGESEVGSESGKAGLSYNDSFHRLAFTTYLKRLSRGWPLLEIKGHISAPTLWLRSKAAGVP